MVLQRAVCVFWEFQAIEMEAGTDLAGDRHCQWLFLVPVKDGR